MPAETKYRRILLKISGEALNAPGSSGIDPSTIGRIAADIKTVREMGVAAGLVLGGGNIIRGAVGEAAGMDRVSSDFMGMLATVINAMAMGDALARIGVPVRVFSAIPMGAICEFYTVAAASRYLDRGEVVICAGGTGNPYFTTDTAAALRASELGCDVLLKATQVDGVYSDDPKNVENAKRFTRLGYLDVLARDLKVMDAAAISLARENGIPILVFSIHNPGALAEAVAGKGKFTLIGDGEE